MTLTKGLWTSAEKQLLNINCKFMSIASGNRVLNGDSDSRYFSPCHQTEENHILLYTLHFHSFIKPLLIMYTYHPYLPNHILTENEHRLKIFAYHSSSIRHTPHTQYSLSAELDQLSTTRSQLGAIGHYGGFHDITAMLYLLSHEMSHYPLRSFHYVLN